jgi:hypothetical protein
MEELLEQWRGWVDDLRGVHLDERLASFLAARVAEVEEALAADENAILTLREAAAFSGYHYDHIRWLVREGRLENAGEKGSPRVRKRDLPRRPLAAFEPEDGQDETLPPCRLPRRQGRGMTIAVPTPH